MSGGPNPPPPDPPKNFEDVQALQEQIQHNLRWNLVAGDMIARYIEKYQREEKKGE